MAGARARVRDTVRRARERADRQRVVDAPELVVVALVGRRARRVGGVSARVGEVVHARVVQRAGRVLVVEPPRVADLLAHHVLLLVRVVVGRGVEVRVVHLDRPLSDVAAREPDARETEPAVGAVGVVADLVAPGRRAAPTLGLTGHDRVLRDRRDVPVRRRLGEVRVPPVRQVVPDLDGERIRRPCPVISAPRMRCGCGHGRHGDERAHQRGDSNDPLHAPPFGRLRLTAATRCSVAASSEVFKTRIGGDTLTRFEE